MLDIKKIENDFEAIKTSLGNRNFDTTILSEILELNKQRKNLITSSESKKA
jgi:seryl-tRNA synthetase